MTKNQDQWEWRISVHQRLDKLETKMDIMLGILACLGLAILGPLVQKLLGG